MTRMIHLDKCGEPAGEPDARRLSEIWQLLASPYPSTIHDVRLITVEDINNDRRQGGRRLFLQARK